MNNKRIRIVYILLAFIMIFEAIFFFFNSGIVEGLFPRADKLKVFAIAMRDDKTILPGDFYDRNGKLIVETSAKTTISYNEEKKTKEIKTKKRTSYGDASKAYSQLIGYTGKRALNPNAASVDKVVRNRSDYRLMAFMDDDYWGENGIYSTTDIDGTKGQSVVLTIDDDLQRYVYEALCKKMDSENNIGSAVVMDAKTGEILSMVSLPAYDFNELNDAKSKMFNDEKDGETEPGYPITYKNAKYPGSIFKVLISVALIDHGMDDFEIVNNDFKVDGYTCKAYSYESKNMKLDLGDDIDLETALKVSSNAYFASAALELGRDNLRETFNRFMLSETSFVDENHDGMDDIDMHRKGEDTTYLATDFGHVQYDINLDVPDSILAQIGFGQGETKLTTVYAAMITQAIANDGKMMQPYLIKELVDANGKVVYKGKEKKLSVATKEKTAKKVTKMMKETAEEACVHYNLKTAEEVFSKYKVAGKTGTAELGDKESRNNAWYISFAPANDPKYVVVVNQCKCPKGTLGAAMIPVVADIYSYLFENEMN